MKSIYKGAAALACGAVPVWACSINFTSPANNAIVTAPTVAVTGTASGFANPSAVGSATATVNGRVFFSQSGTFTVLINFFGSGAATATLDPGIDRLVATGSLSGCPASDSITVVYVPPGNLPDPPKNPLPSPPNCPAGNPCDPATGIKEQSETDYRAPQRLPLTLSRVYRSAVATPGSMGTGWTAWWDRAVPISATDTSAPATCLATRRPRPSRRR